MRENDKLGVLFLTSHLPYPPISGGRLREYQIIGCLAEKCNIYVCAVTKTIDSDMKDAAALQEYCKEIQLFGAYQHKEEMSENLFPEQMIRNRSNSAKEYIEYLLANNCIQVIHCEGYYMVQNIPSSCQVPVVLAEQNIEYSILGQKAAIATDECDKEISEREYEKIYRYERESWEKVDLRIALTKDDYQEIIRQRGVDNTLLISNGIDHMKISHTNNELTNDKGDLSKHKYILYVGNFDYPPNVDAAKVLIDEIYPQIREKYSDIELFVIGNQGDVRLKEYMNNSGVVITGWIDDLMNYYQNALMCVFPLRMGGGIKVKILEALTNNKIVITTKIGAQGIPLVKGSGLHVHNDVRGIINASCEILEQIETNPEIKVSDNSEIMNSFLSWEEACNQLYEAYNYAIKKKTESVV